MDCQLGFSIVQMNSVECQVLKHLRFKFKNNFKGNYDSFYDNDSLSLILGILKITIRLLFPKVLIDVPMID